MPPARKSKSVAIEASAPSEKTKTRTRRKNAPTPKTPKNNDAPSQLVEEGPTATPTSPKKRGRKPKRVAAKADDLPTQNMAEALGTKTADEPTGDPHIGSNLKSKKAPVPARDPLPDRGVRNTHPGVYFGLQPTPRRRPHQVAAACEKKRQELEAQIQAADAIKEKLARMDLEDERAEEALREQGRRRLQFGQNDESSGDEDFDLDGVDTDEKDTDEENTDEEDTDEEDSPSPEPDKEVKGKGKGKGTARKIVSRALRKDIDEKRERLRAEEEEKGATDRGEARFNFSPEDLVPKKYNQAGADTTTMGYFAPEPVIGGLDDEQCATSRPASFGAISSQAMPTIPLGLQRNRNRGNKLVGLSRGVEGENDRVAVVRPSAGVTVNKAPKKTKLKIRALTQQQGGPLPVVDAPLLPVPIPDAQQFICQPTWSKVFLPTLTHLMFVSEYPFKSFKSKTSSFIANVQEAFDATYPHVSYRVTSGDDIAMASLDRLKTKRSLIASDVMKIVKTYFEHARFVNQPEEVKAHAWWGVRPDGLGYHAKPAPIGVTPGSVDYVRPEGRFRSAFIIPVAKKFLAGADGSAILPTIGSQAPPIGLYLLILTAVERAFMSFMSGTFKTPPLFSSDETWSSMETFRRDVFVGLQPAQWVRILDPLGIPDEQDINHADQYDRAILSAYRGGLADFGSP